jgi:uncharacterized OB-fold protein
MQKCKNCQGILLPGANFCHKCGEKTIDETTISTVTDIIDTADAMPAATEGNAKEIKYFNIDFEIVNTLFSPKNDEKETIEIPTIVANEPIKVTDEDTALEDKTEDIKADTLTQKVDFLDFKALFFNALHDRVCDEHDPKEYSEFVERFYKKRFQNTLEQRFELLGEELANIARKMPLPEKPKAKHLSHTIENLVDYFIYTNCEDLESVFPKQLILRYADAQKEDTKKANFYHDFLQLQSENLLIYRDFITMPQEKLKNAFQSYLFTEREELVFFICDLSLLGNGKEGFAISNKRMYWRMPLGKPHSVSFDNLQKITHTEEWLEVNGLFFNVNKSLNMKMLRMLKKIKMIHA